MAGENANSVDAGFCWACQCEGVVGPGVGYRDTIASAPPTDRNPVGTSLVYNVVLRDPWGRRYGYHRAEDFEGKKWA